MKNMNQKLKNSSIFEILKKYNIHPNKLMGQNFLIDENVLNKIIETANIDSSDVILEIGPGLGILTLELAKKAKRVIAIEKDEELCEILKNVLTAQNVVNVEIVHGDILQLQQIQQLQHYKVVANIPYYLTSPLIRKFLEAENKPEFMVLMMQKEVTQRICASPPKMSLLAVSVQFYAEPKIISFVSKNSFYPVPKVDSAIIKIVPQETPKIDTEKFFKLVKRGFASKRKMLKNNIFGINFEKLGLNPNIRAENLTINGWIKLYTFLSYVDK